MFGYAFRLVQYLDLMLLFGLLLFALRHRQCPGSTRDPLPLTKRAMSLTLLAGAALGVVLAGADVFLGVSRIMGFGIWELDRATLIWYAFETSAGRACLARLALLTALAALLALHLRAGDRSDFHPFASVLAGLALVTLTWGGHAAAGEGATGVMRLAAGMAHLLAAGAWIGAIAAFLLLLTRRSALGNRRHQQSLWRSLDAFAGPGTVLVGVLLVTGVLHYGDLTGWSMAFLLHTDHGRVLMFKLVLFMVMLSLAALHRWRSVPRFGRAIQTSNAAHAVRNLRWSMGLEAATFVLIVVSVAVLGTLGPRG